MRSSRHNRAMATLALTCFGLTGLACSGEEPGSGPGPGGDSTSTSVNGNTAVDSTTGSTDTGTTSTGTTTATGTDTTGTTTTTSTTGTTTTTDTGTVTTTDTTGTVTTQNGGAATTGGIGGSSTTGTAQGGATVMGMGGGVAQGGALAAGGAVAQGGSSAMGQAGATATGGSAPSGGAGGADNGGEPVVGVGESDTCPDIQWPASSGSTNLGSGMTVGAGQTYDGQMAVHEGSLEDCSTGDQDSVDALIEVGEGGTVKNIVMGKNVGDGIHCSGSCTIENVWFPYVCDDAISALGGGTVTIRNSGFKNARDKTIQHNGSGTVNMDTIYVETAGKLYRSCGEGCDGANRTATLSNIVAIGVDQIAGISTNDSVTLKNICTYRSAALCTMYDPGTSDESSAGVNSSNEGPSTNCKFAASDTHALLSRVSGIPFTTDAVCGGPNGYKSGSTATTCVAGYDKCLKMCAPGGYGFKELTCTDGRYAEGDGAVCATPTDAAAAQNLAEARVLGATDMVRKNENCSNEWAIGIDISNNNKFCVCVKKPGYYDFDNWLSWDCQDRWW